MQIKRLRKILLDRGIENINYYIDGTGKRDQFIGISFKLYGEMYKIFYRLGCKWKLNHYYGQ